MSKIKNGGLGQYGTGRFEQQQFGTADVEGLNTSELYVDSTTLRQMTARTASQVICKYTFISEIA